MATVTEWSVTAPLLLKLRQYLTLSFFDFQQEFWYDKPIVVYTRIFNTMNDCAFCKIVRGKSAAEILYANQHAIAILDINPIHYGHVLIIPKTHSETFLDVPECELPDLIRATQIVSQAIVDMLKPQGFNIFSNNGKAAGQSVFHVHFHVTPRYDDDNIQFVLKLKKYSSEEMLDYGDRIRQQIRSNIVHEH